MYVCMDKPTECRTRGGDTHELGAQAWRTLRALPRQLASAPPPHPALAGCVVVNVRGRWEEMDPPESHWETEMEEKFRESQMMAVMQQIQYAISVTRGNP